MTFVGKKWIENKFEERMPAFKHAQAIELVRMRVDIEGVVTDAAKRQSAEFEMLAEAWSKLVDAFDQVPALVSPVELRGEEGALHAPDLKEAFVNAADGMWSAMVSKGEASL